MLATLNTIVAGVNTANGTRIVVVTSDQLMLAGAVTQAGVGCAWIGINALEVVGTVRNVASFAEQLLVDANAVFSAVVVCAFLAIVSVCSRCIHGANCA